MEFSYGLIDALPIVTDYPFPPQRRMAGISSLTAVLLLTAGALVAVLALLFFEQLDSVAAVGFLGIIIGGGIATATTLLTARDSLAPHRRCGA